MNTQTTTFITEDTDGNLKSEARSEWTTEDMQKASAVYTITTDGTMTVLKSRYGFQKGKLLPTEADFQEELKRQTFTDRRIATKKAGNEEYRIAFEEEERNNP
jgi:hypothetical protein